MMCLVYAIVTALLNVVVVPRANEYMSYHSQRIVTIHFQLL